MRLGSPALKGVIAVLARGDPVMIPLAACSIMAIAVILERALMWWRVGRSRDREAVLTRAAKGEWTEACKLGETSRVPCPAPEVRYSVGPGKGRRPA